MNDAPVSRFLEQSDQADTDPFAGFPPSRSFSLSRRAKRLILLALTAGAILYLVMKFTVSEGRQATPERTVEGFFQAVVNQEAKEMATYLFFDPAMLPEGIFPDGMSMSIDKLIEIWEKMFEQGSEAVLIHGFKVLDVKQGVDTAEVVSEVELLADEKQSVTYKLKKIEGKWFIDYLA